MHIVRPSLSNEQQLARLDQAVKKQWQCVLGSPLVHAIRAGYFPKELYAIYMVETFHYTAHNARNQAVSGVAHASRNPVYGKFCFEHAGEESGREFMALQDLKALGLALPDGKLPPPLPTTETLIGYLYWIAAEGNPYRRLGYSYWANGSHQYIDPLVQGVRTALGIAATRPAFFNANLHAGDGSAKAVRQILLHTCRDEDDWDAVIEAAETSLHLTGRMIDAVYGEYEKLKAGKSKRYQPMLGGRR